MALKGFLQSAYQNALNIDDIAFEDRGHRKNLPLTHFKLFTSNIQLINRLVTEGKLDPVKAAAFVERQKESTRKALGLMPGMSPAEIEKTIENSVKTICSK
ncbi:MAG TPA: hypothetical protein VK177_13845 [Flavobacteriales bacterium]|nr:hypothetical protein [Flavobacteriales bacterium]